MDAQGVDLPIGGIFAVIAQNVFTEGPADLVDTFFGVNTYTPPNIPVPGNEEMLAFIEESGNAEYAEKSTNTNFVTGWVIAKLAVEGIRRAAETRSITRDSLAAALDALSGFDTGGQSPVLDCTRPGHHCGAVARPYTWDGTQLVAVGEYEDWVDALDFEYGLFTPTS
ncbi:MAG: hypothetical protein KatS3mg011_2243 [Acidimicrobiia bacterium]|nr:MAG: hypothetical protein KatS3mg011_2243 [Acidimicrobiia bacterium]